jgi:internalin A
MSEITRDSHRPRLRLRVRLRELIALVLIVGGWLGWIVHRARIQREAIVAIEKAHGQIVYNWQLSKGAVVQGAKPPKPGWLGTWLGREYFERPIRVSFPWNTFTGHIPNDDGDAALAHVGQLDTIEKLDFSAGTLTERGLIHLRSLRRLRRLVITRTGNQPAVTGGLDALQGMSRLEELDLSRLPATDKALLPLRSVGSLKTLVLSPATTDAGLVHLRGLSGLRALDLQSAAISNDGLKHLSNLTGLQELRLDLTRVSNLAPLRSLKELKVLSLIASAVTDEGLAPIENLTALRDLNLYQTKVTDTGLAYLRNLTSLDHLYLRALPRVTNVGIAHLSGLNRLTDLDLERTKIDDEGLHALGRLPKLQNVNVWGTRVTDSGVEECRKANPSLYVAR